MPNQTKNLLIGLFVLSASALIVWMLMFIHPTVGDAGQVFHVRFTDVDKVSVGTRVTFAGRPVGEVTEIQTIREARTQELARATRRVYIYDLTIAVDSSVQVYASDEIALRTSGLLGERSIAIIPRVPKAGTELRLLTEGDIIYSTSSGTMEEALSEMSELVDSAGTAMDEVLAMLKENRTNISEAIGSFNSALKSVDRALQRADETNMMANLSSAAAGMNTTLEYMNRELVTFHERRVMDRIADTTENVASISNAFNQPEHLDSIVSNIDSLSGNLNDIAGKTQVMWPKIERGIEDFSGAAKSAQSMAAAGSLLFADARKFFGPMLEGKGSVARFLRDEDFYLRTQALLSKADTLMNDLNHYGLLFHLNRGWKRTRTARANTIEKLQTANDFRNFFETELDTINTSVARVAMLMAEAEERRDDERLVNQEAFSKAFSELLRQINGIEDNIQLYNQSLQSTE